METKASNLDTIIKLFLSLFVFMGVLIFSSQTWAAKPSTTSQQYLPGTSEYATYAWHRRPPPWRWRRGWRGGYYPPYWGPWRPYWRGGVYCRKRCLTNRWGRIIRCRVSCY